MIKRGQYTQRLLVVARNMCISTYERDYMLVNSSFVARIRNVSLICLISGHKEFPARIRDHMRRTAFPSCDAVKCSTFRSWRPVSHGSSDSRHSATRARTQLMIWLSATEDTLPYNVLSTQLRIGDLPVICVSLDVASISPNHFHTKIPHSKAHMEC
jgi:hypothetical protein